MAGDQVRSFADGRYIVQRGLGEGAQKVVYLVHDTQLERDCALASLKAGDLDRSKLARIKHEARAMAKLSAHENIVTVHDIGEQDGAPFMVCEYVGGGDLAAQIDAHGAFELDRAVAIGKDLCHALAVAHEAGVIHRDVKPANVWLTESGRAKLGDFGLALATDHARVTVDGVVIGTPYYMAPEQALTGEVDPRSDLYALGCVLYHMLTNTPPYRGASVVEVIGKHLHATPTPPSRVAPSVSRALDDIVLSLLAKRPDDRPASAEDVLARLEALGTPAASIDAEVARPLDGLAEASFLGRTAELNALKAALDRAVAGEGCSRTIAGEAGVGKSRLVRELSTYARLRAIPVLIGGCEAADGAPPYLPFVEALDAPAAQLDPGTLGPELRILAQLLPGLSASVGSGVVRDGADRYEVFCAVVALLRRVAKPNGLVLVLEDLHWADKPSLLLLEYLAAHTADVKVLIVGTYRDVEVARTHPLGETLANLRRERAHERITLKRLGPAAARALIDELAQLSKSSVNAILEQTEGHPLFIEEVLKHLLEEGVLGGADELSGHALAELGVPEGIRDVIGRRLSRLGERCNRMLTRASALPSAIRWTLLTAIWDGDEDELLDLLDEALAAQIVHERRDDPSGAYEFTHALIRQALYEELSVPRRARLHVQIGEAIERLHADDLEPHLSELAHHFFQASAGAAREKAIDYAVRAGERSMRRMAFEDAAHHYQRALSALVDRDDVNSRIRRAELHRRRGLALSVVCAWADARAEFEQGLEQLPPDRDVERARLLLHNSFTLFWNMKIPGLLSSAGEALELAKGVGDPDLEAAATAFLAIGAASDGDLEESCSQYDHARSLVSDTSDPLVARSMFIAPQSLYWLGRYQETVTCGTELGEVARANHDGSMQMLMLPVIGLSLGAEGRYREASQVFAASARFGRDHNIRGLLARSIAMSVGNLVETFDYGAATARAEEALDMARTHGFEPTFISSQIDLMFIEIASGELGAGEQRVPTIAKALEKTIGFHEWVFAMRFALARARLAGTKKDWSSALEAADATVAQARSVGRLKYEAGGMAARAMALVGLGRKNDAIADLKSAVEITRTLRYPALLLRYGGDLLELAGDDPLLDEVRSSVSCIAAELDSAALQHFKASPMVRRIASL